MVESISEVVWIKDIHEKFSIMKDRFIHLQSNNMSAMDIANNPVQHNRTKHLEINRHFIRENLDSGIIKISNSLSDQVTEIYQEITRTSIQATHIQVRLERYPWANLRGSVISALFYFSYMFIRWRKRVYQVIQDPLPPYVKGAFVHMGMIVFIFLEFDKHSGFDFSMLLPMV